VKGLMELDDAELAATAVEAVYGQALLLSKRPIRAAEAALLNRAFLGLIGNAVGRAAQEPGIPTTESGAE
jgi:molecular chaperone HtpG